MIDQNLLKIANYLRATFDGTPSVRRCYASDESKRFVDIISTPHPDRVTYLGTIGCSSRKMKGQPAGQKEIRVELLSAVDSKYVDEMSKILGFLTFCLDTEAAFYRPGLIIENAIEMPKSAMKHIYLCDPFLWDDGLPSLPLDDYPVAFLYALPISDGECKYHSEKGHSAFEKLLAKGDGVKYNDLSRASLV